MINILIMGTRQFDLLSVLIAAAESPNLRSAADRLGISQPAVTAKLKEIENGQPQPVFSLQGKRKVPTLFGRALYEVAKRETEHFAMSIEGVHRLYGDPKNLTIRLGGRA